MSGSMGRPIARSVLIELLYEVHGIRWAGWYNDDNLRAKWDAMGAGFMTGGFVKPDFDPSDWEWER